MSPQTTQLWYSASDGVIGDAGDLGVRNLLLVSGDAGGEANVVGTLVNTGAEELNVQLSSTAAAAGEAAEPITVPANSSLAVGSADGPELLVPISTRPGMLEPFAVSAGGETLELAVPVLDGTLPEYSAYMPPGATMAPTPTETAAPEAEEAGGGH